MCPAMASRPDLIPPVALTIADSILFGIVVAPIAALIVWGIVRLQQARAAIRAQLDAEGLEILELRRSLRHGPFAGSTARGHSVYRVTVRDRSGAERRGWARWGRPWLTSPDALELRWDE